MQANKIFEKIHTLRQLQNWLLFFRNRFPTPTGWDGIEADLQYAIDNLPVTKYNNEKAV